MPDFADYRARFSAEDSSFQTAGTRILNTLKNIDSALANTVAQFVLLDGALNTTGTAFGNWISAAGLATQALRDLNSQITSLNRRTGAATTTVEAFDAVLKEVTPDAVAAAAALAGVSGQMRSITGASTGASAAAGRSTQGMAMGFRRLGMALETYVAIPLLGLSALAAKAFSDVESAMTKSVALAGMPKGEANVFSKLLPGLSEKFGVSQKNLAEGLFFITSMQQHGTKAYDLLKASAEGAAIGMGEVKDVANETLTLMYTFGGTAQHNLDLVTRAVTLARVDPSTLLKSIGPTLPIAKSMGIGEGDFLGASAIMTRAGFNATQGMTSLRSIMISMAAPTSKVAKEFKSIGVDPGKFRQNMQRDLLGTLESLGPKAHEILAKIIGLAGQRRSAAGLLTLVDPANAKQNEDVMKGMREAADAADRAFKVVSQTIGFHFKQALEAGRNALISWGGAVREHVIKTLDTIKGLFDRFQNLPDSTKEAFGKAAIAIGAFALVAGRLLSLMPAIAAVRTMLAGLAAAGVGLGEVLWPVAIAIGVVAAAMYAFKNNLGGFRTVSIAAFESIRQASTRFAGQVAGTLSVLQGTLHALGKAFGWVAAVSVAVCAQMINAYLAYSNWFMNSVIRPIAVAWQTTWDRLPNVVTMAKDAVVIIVESMAAKVLTIVAGMLDGIGLATSNIKRAIAGFQGDIGDHQVEGAQASQSYAEQYKANDAKFNKAAGGFKAYNPFGSMKGVQGPGISINDDSPSVQQAQWQDALHKYDSLTGPIGGNKSGLDVGGSDPVGAGGAGKGSHKESPEDKATKSLQEAIEGYQLELKKGIKDTTEATAVFETMYGKWKLAPQALKDNAIGLAKQVDAFKDYREALKSTISAEDSARVAYNKSRLALHDYGTDPAGLEAQLRDEYANEMTKGAKTSFAALTDSTEKANIAARAHFVVLTQENDATKKLNESVKEGLLASKLRIASLGKETEVEKTLLEFQSGGKYAKLSPLARIPVLQQAGQEDFAKTLYDSKQKVDEMFNALTTKSEEGLSHVAKLRIMFEGVGKAAHDAWLLGQAALSAVSGTTPNSDMKGMGALASKLDSADALKAQASLTKTLNEEADTAAGKVPNAVERARLAWQKFYDAHIEDIKHATASATSWVSALLYIQSLQKKVTDTYNLSEQTQQTANFTAKMKELRKELEQLHGHTSHEQRVQDQMGVDPTNPNKPLDMTRQQAEAVVKMQDYVNKITKLVNTVAEAGANIIGNAMTYFTEHGVKGLFNSIKQDLTKTIQSTLINNLKDKVKQGLTDLLMGKNGKSDPVSKNTDAVNNLTTTLQNYLNTLTGSNGGCFGLGQGASGANIFSMAGAAMSGNTGGLLGSLGSMAGGWFKQGGGGGNDWGSMLAGANFLGFASGGEWDGTQPARVHDGELLLPATGNRTQVVNSHDAKSINSSGGDTHYHVHMHFPEGTQADKKTAIQTARDTHKHLRYLQGQVS